MVKSDKIKNTNNINQKKVGVSLKSGIFAPDKGGITQFSYTDLSGEIDIEHLLEDISSHEDIPQSSTKDITHSEDDIPRRTYQKIDETHMTVSTRLRSANKQLQFSTPIKNHIGIGDLKVKVNLIYILSTQRNTTKTFDVNRIILVDDLLAEKKVIAGPSTAKNFREFVLTDESYIPYNEIITIHKEQLSHKFEHHKHP